ncbi:MAG: CsgG/HfaB family protein [Phycisphaerales bacterium]
MIKTALMITALGGTVFGGCAGPQTSRERLVNTSESLASVPFVAPHDPAMRAVVLAVPEVIVSAPVNCESAALGIAVRSQLASALSASPNFIVADRSILADVAEEHQLADSNVASEAHKIKSGQLAIAEYLVKVDVTELKESVVGNQDGNGFRLGGLLSVLDNVIGGAVYRTTSDAIKSADPVIGQRSQTVEGVVGMEVRVVDVSTGTVVFANRVQAKLTSKNSTVVLGIAGLTQDSSDFSTSVIAQATRTAAEDATRKIHAGLQRIIMHDSTTREGVSLASSSR